MRIEIVEGDVTRAEVDVLALKFAQDHYGADHYVYERLREAGVPERELTPQPDAVSIVRGTDPIKAREVLFVGTVPLYELDYTALRKLARSFLSRLAEHRPATRSLALTIHGPGFGLDEEEAFESMIAGLVDAAGSDEAPKELSVVRFVEQRPARVEHLRKVLEDLLPDGLLRSNVARNPRARTEERLRAAGYASAGKPHVFVAMPFAEDFQDVYDYAIQNAVRRTGFLCERVDADSFTGDVLTRIQDRIRTATFVIADLTTANANVYLEVGYAWGCQVPCILLARDSAELKFDVCGQRCIIYKRIKDLEEKLAAELVALVATTASNSGLQLSKPSLRSGFRS